MSDIPIERLRSLAADFVAAEPDRIGTEGFWKAPLLVSAPVDERFDILPQVGILLAMGVVFFGIAVWRFKFE